MLFKSFKPIGSAVENLFLNATDEAEIERVVVPCRFFRSQITKRIDDNAENHIEQNDKDDEEEDDVKPPSSTERVRHDVTNTTLETKSIAQGRQQT